MRHSYRIPLLIGALALSLTDCSRAEYPPNNAAVLYYRGFLHYAAPQGDRIAKMKAVVRGKAALDDDLNRFIGGNHRVIEHANLAATIPFCDWGLDYERGVGMLLPDLHHASQVLDLMIANARRLAAEPDLAKAPLSPRSSRCTRAADAASRILLSRFDTNPANAALC